MRICELRQMEVINKCDCKRLGFVDDIDVDLCNGTVKEIIVPGEPKLCGMFGRDGEYIIPFECIDCVGHDVILIKADSKELYKKCKI